MNATKLFYTHESDSNIMVKKDKAEVSNWTDELEFINEELEHLIDIEDRMLNNTDLYQQLHTLRRENTLKLGTLYRYERTIGKAIECDTVSCDTYYLNHHEKNRDTYVSHLQKYRNIKKRMLSQVLLNVKH